MAQYQDTITRLLLEEADEAVTRADVDEMLPVAPAAHVLRGEELLHVYSKRAVLEIAKHLVDHTVHPCWMS